MALFHKKNNAGSSAVELIATLPILISVIIGLTTYFMYLWSDVILDFYIEKTLVETLETKNPYTAEKKLILSYRTLVPWVKLRQTSLTLRADKDLKLVANAKITYCFKMMCTKTRKVKHRNLSEKRIMDMRI